MSSLIDIYQFLKTEKEKDPLNWFTVREVSKIFCLSVDRTRKHLSLLVLSDDAERRLEGWFYQYRAK